MYDLTTDASSLDWSPTGWAGVTMKLLNRGDNGGGTTGLMRLDAGSVIPAHRHTTADQSVYILEGDLIDAGVTYGPGTLIVAKAGTPHGPHSTKGGCVLLSIYHGTPDFVVVE
jgi:quercetin dioxygenase-like cupin family protein